MPSQLSQFCTKLIDRGITFTLVSVPLFFLLSSNNHFTLPKVMLFRTMVLILLAAWVVEIIENRNYQRNQNRAENNKIEPKRKFFQIKFTRPMLALAGLFIIATIFSIDWRSSLWGYGERMDGLYTFLCYLIFFFITAAHITEKKQIEKNIRWLIYASLIVVFYAILQHFGQDFVTGWSADTKARVIATLGNPLHVGAYAMMLIPFTLIWIILNKKPKTRLVFSIILLLQFLTLLYTLTRSAYLGFLGSALVLVFLLGLKYRKKIVWIGTIALVGLGVIFIGVSAMPNSPLHFANQNRYIERLASSFTMKDTSSLARLTIWKMTAGLIAERPIFGHGPGTFLMSFNTHIPGEMIKHDLQDYFSPHNQLLYWAYSFGLPTVMVLLLLYGSFFFSGIKLYLQTQDRFKAWVSLACLTAMAGFFAQNLFSIIYPTIYIYWMFLFGLMAAMLQPDFDAPRPAPISKKIQTTDGKLIPIYIITAVLSLLMIIFTNLMPLIANIQFKKIQASRDANQRDSLYRSALANANAQEDIQYRQAYAQELAIVAYQNQTSLGAARTEQLIDAAIDQAQTLKNLHPAHAEAHLLLGKIYYIASQLNHPEYQELADRHYQTAAALMPGRQKALWDWGNTLIAIHQTEQGLEKFQRAIDLAPDAPIAYQQYADKLKALGFAERAQAVLEQISAR